MHKIIKCFFNNLNNIENFFSLVCSFFIFTTCSYWIEQILKVKWDWLNFIRPVLDNILLFSKNILPIKINTFFETDHVNFIAAIALLVIMLVLTKYIFERLSELRPVYENYFYNNKIVAEKKFNNKLSKQALKQMIKNQSSKYMILINTRIKKKFSHKELNIDINEQNKLMNDFLISKTESKPENYYNGFLYYFDDFDKVDHVLHIMYKLLKSSAPIDYAICVQIGVDLKQIKKLADLERYGKIIMDADTLLRYQYNKSHLYATQCTGVYQKEDGVIEVHEFQEMST